MPDATHPIPAPGTISGSWVPQEIVIVYWTIDTTNGCCKIDTAQSGVYDASYFSSKYASIKDFAFAVSDGTISAGPPAPLYPNLGPFAQPWNFVIKNSCYIVYVLEQGMTQWQFLRGSTALTTVDDETGWYQDLNHVIPPPQSSQNPPTVASTVTGPNCMVAYFSAYVQPNTQTGIDAFALHVEYLQTGQWIILPDDPAIKNKGHPHGVRSNPLSLKLTTILPDALKQTA